MAKDPSYAKEIASKMVENTLVRMHNAEALALYLKNNQSNAAKFKNDAP